MKTVLVILALACAIVLALLGFEVVTADEPRLFGWLGLTLALWIGSTLVPDR